MYLGINCEIWELFSLSCQNADANAGAPSKQPFCSVFQERLPAERRWWDPWLLPRVEMSLLQSGSCILVFVEILMLTLTLDPASITAMFSHVTVM